MKDIISSFVKPLEIRALIIKYLNSLNNNPEMPIESDTDFLSKFCFYKLFKTSPQFARSITNFDKDLKDAICALVCVVNALSRIESCRSISFIKKQELLKTFTDKLNKNDWILLTSDLNQNKIFEEYHYFANQILNVKPIYKEIIQKVVLDFGNTFKDFQILTVNEYNQFCARSNCLQQGLADLFFKAGLLSNNYRYLSAQAGIFNFQKDYFYKKSVLYKMLKQ